MKVLGLSPDSSEEEIIGKISELKVDYKEKLLKYGVNPDSLESYLESYDTLDPEIYIDSNDKAIDSLNPDSRKEVLEILDKYHELLNVERALLPDSYKHYGKTPNIFPNLNIDPLRNTKNPYLKRIIEENDNYGLQEDVFATLGVMLNISTDSNISL